MIGARLKELRLSKGYTLRELGEIIGVSESTMSLYEHDKRDPDYATLKKITEVFSVSFEFMLGLSAAQKKELTSGIGELSNAESDLIDLFRQIPPAEHARVLKMIQAALDNR